MNSVVEDVKDMLLADVELNAVVQLVFAGNLHMYKEPATPDDVVTLFEAPGMPPLPVLTEEGKKPYERPALQIRVRHTNPDTGYSWAYALLKSLHMRAHEVWGDYTYSVIYQTSNPTLIDYDANGRARIVLNFNIQRKLN